tara:strand:+ start:279 stop:584 length:306 start_codon:yes stop_codon:yes gene_type:complete
MIDKVFAAGCLIVLAKMSILSQAIAEPVLRAPKEQDFFLIGFVSLCVGIVGFSNYLTLKQIWGDEKFYQNPVFQLIGWSALVCILWGGWKILIKLYQSIEF